MLQWIFIAKCGIMRFLCAMCVFKVWASSSSPRLPLCQILFLSQHPLLPWPMEKNHILNHSLNHPAYLMPWESRNSGYKRGPQTAMLGHCMVTRCMSVLAMRQDEINDELTVQVESQKAQQWCQTLAHQAHECCPSY